MADITRIFFALWPDESVREQIVSQTMPWLKSHRRLVPAHNLHLTLAFVGNIDSALLAGYRQAAATVHGERFALTMDQVGNFSRAQVLWLGCSEVPDALRLLVSHLNAAIEPCGYRPERRPYVPHLTLARKYRKKPPRDMRVRIHWSVRDFCLIESRQREGGGVMYHVLESWPLLA